MEKIKKTCNCNNIPMDLVKWSYLEKMKTFFSETKQIFIWKWKLGCTGTPLMEQKLTSIS